MVNSVLIQDDKEKSEVMGLFNDFYWYGCKLC